MKTIAKLLSLVMLVSMVSVPVYAAESSDELIEAFVDNVMSLSDEQKGSYLELLELINDLDDASGMLAAYTTAMNNMAGGDQTKFEALKKVLDNLEAITNDVLDSDLTLSVFKSYVNSNDGGVALEAALKLRSAAFVSALGGMDIALMDYGFDRMKEMYNYQAAAAGIGASFIMITQNSSSDFDVYDIGVNAIVGFSGLLPELSGVDEALLTAAIQQLADYYNSSSQKSLLYSFFTDNGLVKVDSTYGADTGSGTGTGTGTDTGTTTPVIPVETPVVEEDLGLDDEVPEGTALFGDIGRFTWAWTAIRQLYIADVIKGKSETEFDPSGDITRAEFSALLSRLLETSIPTDTPTLEGIFSDVNNGKWYYGEVMSVFKAGYVRGVSVTEFDPTANIDREQIATILARVLISQGVEEISASEVDSVLNEFADADKVSSWAKTGSAMVADLGIIGGVNVGDDKYFNFKENASRAEVSVMLYRLAQIIETKVEIIE